jgi:hypothetical protein
VLERSGHHPIAGPDQPFQGQVQRIGAIEREDDPLGAWCVEHAADILARIVDQLFRRDRQPVRRPARIAAVLAHRARRGRVHRLGLRPARRGVV